MISFEYIQFLNQKILEYLPANSLHIGDKINMRCPLCGDSHKSATKKRGWWYNRTASYYCFNCSTGMSGIKFLQALSGQNYEDIRKEYAKLFLKTGLNANLSSNFEVPDSEPDIFNLTQIVKPEWKNELSAKAREYLSSRKVLDAPFLSDQLYSYYSQANQEFILIPWILNGCEAYYQLNDFQHLTTMKYIFPKSKKKLIAGLDNVDISWPYIICFEGFYDSVFVKNGVCLGTKAITDYQLKIIKERYPHHQIVIAFDNDKSGIQSTIKLLENKTQFKYLKWFDSGTEQKDINDFVLSKNDVNIFADKNHLDEMIVDRLRMKMFLLENQMWVGAHHRKAKASNNNDSSPFWKTRKI